VDRARVNDICRVKTGGDAIAMSKPDYESMSDLKLLAHLAYRYPQATEEGKKLIQEAVSPEIFKLITHPDVQKAVVEARSS